MQLSGAHGGALSASHSSTSSVKSATVRIDSSPQRHEHEVQRIEPEVLLEAHRRLERLCAEPEVARQRETETIALQLDHVFSDARTPADRSPWGPSATIRYEAPRPR